MEASGSSDKIFSLLLVLDAELPVVEVVLLVVEVAFPVIDVILWVVVVELRVVSLRR